LAFSMNTNYLQLIEDFYHSFFAPLGRVEVKRITEIEENKRGYDSLIVFDGGEQYIKVEQKVDRHDSPNLVLELWSDAYKKPGWLMTARCDWLAYTYINKGVTHMLPFPALKKAFAERENEWRDIYRIVTIENRGWDTEIMLVPLEDLWQAIQETLIHDHYIESGERWREG
jgi:hypothetical protein